jgi:hypothetical protein
MEKQNVTTPLSATATVEFPTSPLRATATPSTGFGELHPSRMIPAAYFCYQCECEYRRPPAEQLNPTTGALLKRLCGVCRSEAVEIIEAPEQSREAAAYVRRRNVGQHRANTQPVVMRVIETLPDGSTVVRTTQVHVPFQGSQAANRANFFTALGPFAAFGQPAVGHGDTFEETLNRLFEQAQTAYDDRGSPADPQVLAQLPRFSVASDQSLDECTVCMGAPEAGDACVKLPCGHVFHDECLAPWMRAHDTCPTCRRSLPAAAAPATESS